MEVDMRNGGMRFAGFLLGYILATGQVWAQSSVAGVWSGTVAQNIGSSGYTVVMTISDSGASTDYPQLSCGGSLKRVASSGSYTFFTETITRGRQDQGGRCIDGTVTIALAQGKLAWGWFGAFQGKAMTAYALLSRQQR
jgi:hypothetical protein